MNTLKNGLFLLCWQFRNWHLKKLFDYPHIRVVENLRSAREPLVKAMRKTCTINLDSF